MEKLFYTLVIFCVCSCSSDQEAIQFQNGHWFNGTGFEETIFFSVDGILTKNYTQTPDTIIDLKQGFVIPPFGDAHTHNLADPDGIDEMKSKYLREGVFYVQVLTNYASKADSVKAVFKSSETIDVSYANGGLTATLGHPFVAYETSALGLHWSAMFSQRDKIKQSRLAENDAYWFLDSIGDIEEKWSSILASNPDLIKIYLINTDRHKELYESEQMGNFGLSEEVAREIVKKAKESGLRVYAHVETANDFRVGLDIGVDGFGHLPGYSWDGREDVEMYRLSNDDLKLAKERDIVIIPTANFAKVYAVRYDNRGNSTLDEERLRTVNSFLKNEIQRIHKADIQIVIGSDQHQQTSLIEADYLVNELEAFDELTILKLLSEVTPGSIYPNRKIGKLMEGYEASFLVLEGNPVKDWKYTKSIKMRVKQGHILNLTKDE